MNGGVYYNEKENHIVFTQEFEYSLWILENKTKIITKIRLRSLENNER